MPFITQYVRLTNSGKLPEIFVTSKVQGAQELQNAKLGKLFFLLQINTSWKQGAAVGSSIINIISREYFRQEGSTPLESFERALAKANRLLEQLARDGETAQESLDAIIALSVGDELHVTATGEAEAYFIRDDKINLITEVGNRSHDPLQTFNNIVTGEISAGDIAVFGSPAVYEALTTEDLLVTMQRPLYEAGKQLARRIREQKIRYANAIILHFDTLRSIENSTTPAIEKTIYLDQPIDSTLSIIGFNAAKIGKPVGKFLGAFANKAGKHAVKHSESLKKRIPKKITVPPAAEKLRASIGSFKFPTRNTTATKAPVMELPDAPVPVNSYLNKNLKANRRHFKWLSKLFRVPLIFIQNLGMQFHQAIRRSPRTWYIVIALLILSSIGASIQTRNKDSVNPSVTTARYDELKDLVKQADDAKTFGNNEKARQFLAEVVTKGATIDKNSKQAEAAEQLVSKARSDLRTLSGVTDLIVSNPLITLTKTVERGNIFEGTFYYTSEDDGELYSNLLTGGNSTLLSNYADTTEGANLFYLDPANKDIYVQTNKPNLYRYNTAEKFKKVSSPTDITVGSAMATYLDTLYVLDQYTNQIVKYSITDDGFGEGSNYIKKRGREIMDTVDMAIDGAIFVLFKDGKVEKYSRGNHVDFALSAVPIPYDKIEQPLRFFAVEDGTAYYLADKGNSVTPPRIIEYDKTGKFIHQYFMPQKWQGDLKLVMANPKTHKAWAVVGKELYEFTLVQ